MSLTTFSQGRAAKAGYKLVTSYDWDTGTGVELGAGDGLELLPSGTPKTEIGAIENQGLCGAGVQLAKLVGTESVSGSPSFNFAYYDVRRLIMSAYGAETVADLTGGAYSHLATIDEINSNVGSFAWPDKLVAHDIENCKVGGYEATFEEGALGVFKPDLLGRRELTDGSGSNTLATLAAVTLPTAPTTRYVLHPQFTVRMNAASGSALAGGDVIKPSKITIKLERGWASRRTTANGLFIDAPVGGAWIKTSLALDFPINEVAAHYGWMRALTELKCDVVASGSAIGASGFNDQYKWEWPLLQVDASGWPDLNTPDLLTITLNGEGHTARDSLTSGMLFSGHRLTIQDNEAISHLTNGT